MCSFPLYSTTLTNDTAVSYISDHHDEPEYSDGDYFLPFTLFVLAAVLFVCVICLGFLVCFSFLIGVLMCLGIASASFVYGFYLRSFHSGIHLFIGITTTILITFVSVFSCVFIFAILEWFSFWEYLIFGGLCGLIGGLVASYILLTWIVPFIMRFIVERYYKTQI
jgi:hypothetical protein